MLLAVARLAHSLDSGSSGWLQTGRNPRERVRRQQSAQLVPVYEQRVEAEQATTAPEVLLREIDEPGLNGLFHT